jgi:thiol-disulfide isomerase/thioredoxin
MKIILIIFIIMISQATYAKYERYNIQTYENPILFPEISFYDNLGVGHLMEEFDGSVVLVAMWASWCHVCANELPELDLLQKKFLKKPIKILALSEDFKGIEKVTEFYQQYNIKFLDVYLDSKNAIFNQLEAVSLPTSFLVNSSGYIIAKITGEVDWNDDKINQLLLDTASNASVNYNKKPAKVIKPEPKQDQKKEFEIPNEAITYIE